MVAAVWKSLSRPPDRAWTWAGCPSQSVPTSMSCVATGERRWRKRTNAPRRSIACCKPSQVALAAVANEDLLSALLCRNASTPRICRAQVITGVDGAQSTWGEARAECLAQGRNLCSLEQLSQGSGCTLDRGAATGAPLLWTRSPCHVRGSPAAGSGYTSIKHIAPTCASSDHQLEDVANISLEQCLHRCDETTGVRRSKLGHRMVIPTLRCATVGYSFVTRDCRLLRLCSEREGTTYGQCKHGYMLQPQGQLWDYLRRYNTSSSRRWFLRPDQVGFAWCHFTRGYTSTTSSSLRRRKRLANAWRDAQKMREELKQRHPNASVCTRPLLKEEEEGVLVEATWGATWRYYTAVECGAEAAVIGQQQRQICLIFKHMGFKAVLGGLRSTDGVHFGERTEMLRLPVPWHEAMFTHNAALLALGGGEYALLGGTQGFVSNTTCRRALRKSKALDPSQHHAACLQLDRREPYLEDATSSSSTTMDEQQAASPSSENEVVDEDAVDVDFLQRPPSNGIRLSRGHGLPWTPKQWSAPRTVITGDAPSQCVDRRPHYTGYPRLVACQFDGRLSLVKAGGDGAFLLYARANLRSGSVAGGRFVQVTRSTQLESGWQPWQPITIRGVDPQSMDLYFFAVQANPIRPSTLLALFPLTEPPFACVAFAVSRDGVRFSSASNLHQSKLGVRPTTSDAELHGMPALEWRGEDHPAANLVLSPTDPKVALVYIHHAVKGTTMRKSAVPHVRAYKLSVAELERQTDRLLRELD